MYYYWTVLQMTSDKQNVGWLGYQYEETTFILMQTKLQKLNKYKVCMDVLQLPGYSNRRGQSLSVTWSKMIKWCLTHLANDQLIFKFQPWDINILWFSPAWIRQQSYFPMMKMGLSGPYIRLGSVRLEKSCDERAIHIIKSISKWLRQ